MKRADKEKVVEELTEKFQEANSLVITDYRGLNVGEMNQLRSKLTSSGVEYRVVKNTLAIFAARGTGFEGLEEYFSGPTAIAFGMEDPVLPAKLISEYAKKNKILKIKGGLVEGRVISEEKVDSLAKIPPREVLLSQVVAGFKSPINRLVMTLNGPMGGFVQVLRAIKEKREETT